MRFAPYALVSALLLVALQTAPAVRAEAPDPAQPLWMRSPAISPDGSTIAFTYRGRVYTVDAAGGEARPLTEPPYRATDPVWAPDGRSLAFSAAVFNEGDVYVAPLDGGEIRRLTFNPLLDRPLAFTPDGRDVVIQAFGRAPMEANFFDGISKYMVGHVGTVPAAGGRGRVLMPIPAAQASVSPDGNLVAYAFARSPEVPQRKRQISDGTSDIWIFDRTTGRHRQLTHHRASEKSPVFSADGRYVYFTAEMPAGGEADVDAPAVSTNVWRMPADGSGAPEQLTFHDTLPVRGLSVSRDGTVSYGYDGEIWTVAPGGTPQKVAIRIAQGTLATGRVPLDADDQVSEIAVSPDGSEIALVARGDVFVVKAATGETRRITDTPQAERSVGFSPDGRKLLYASDRRLDWDLFESRIVRGEDSGFVDAAEIAESVLLDTDTDLLQPLYSPGGDRVAYRNGRNAIEVLELASGRIYPVLPDDATYSYEEGDLSHAWSPDGRYVTTISGFTVGNAEIEVIEVATGQRHNISLNGFVDLEPRFSRDGAMVYWLSTRYSTRPLDDQATTMDVVGTFLSREAATAFAAGEPVTAGPPDFAGAPDRTLRLTGATQIVGFADLGADGSALNLVVLTPGSGLSGYAVDIRTGAARLLFQRDAAGDERFAVDRDGKTLYVAGGGRIDAYDLATGEARAIPFDTTAPHDYRAEMAYLFDHQWRLVQSKFYDKGLHGVDWPRMRDLYARQLPHIAHWEDFAELMAEMQGELNASHMFANFQPGEPSWDQGAALGVDYDLTHAGPGVRIAGVIAGGPADVPGSLLVPGAVIMTVDGAAIGPDADIVPLLDRKAGQRVLLGVAAPGTATVAEQVVTPIGIAEEAALAYRRWIEQRRAIVAERSGGRLGYVHVAAMNDEEMRKAYAELLGRYGKAEGAIVDVRFNVGGFLHDQLIAFLSGTRHSGLVTRNGVDLGSAPLDRWAKPTALVQNAFSYSDGSVFPMFYKREALGPIVGDRVPGTGTAVYTAPQLEPRLSFSVAQLGFRTREGQFFENTEIVPDIRVPTDPNFVMEGRDPQLEAAVKALLDVIDAK
ncbi:MAG: S41 family peptidase [Geminicoccaceae bacterium]